MPEKKPIEVRPESGQWVVARQGSTRALSKHSTQKEAEPLGRERARRGACQPRRLTQRAGSRIASGFGDTSDFVCTGATQTVHVLVHAQDQAFKKGPAVAEASLFICTDFFFCQSVRDTENIEIVR